MFIVIFVEILESKTMVDTVLSKSIPPVNVASPLTLIVVPDESARTLIACPSY